MADDMLMYGYVVPKCLEGGTKERCLVPRAIERCWACGLRTQSLSPCLLHLHTIQETSALLSTPYHPNIVNIAAHQNYRKRNCLGVRRIFSTGSASIITILGPIGSLSLEISYIFKNQSRHFSSLGLRRY